MLQEETSEEILETLKSEPEIVEDTYKNDQSPLSKKYAFPISLPLRADPPRIMNWPERLLPDKTRKEQLQLVQDYEMLISANQRAEKEIEEAYARFSLGIVLDNLERPEEALPYYLRFLEVMLAENDQEFLAVAYNVLGVNFQLMGRGYFKHSAYCHKKHSELADEEGKFLASVNLGLLYLSVNSPEKTKNCFKAALKHSIQMQSHHAQAISIGFQGLANIASSDFKTAKACFERYCQLSNHIRDVSGQAKASLNLAHIAAYEKDMETAEQLYQQAIRVCSLYSDSTIETTAKISLGLLRSQKKMNLDTIMKKKRNHKVELPAITEQRMEN